MRKVTLKLKSFGNRWNEYFYAKKSCDPLLCRSTLGKLFTLPRKKSTPISFVISIKELPDSYKVRYCGYSVEVFSDGEWSAEVTYVDAKKLLKTLGLIDKEFWVSLHWEE